MAVDKYQFLNEAGVQQLLQEMFAKVNLRIGERIVTEVSESSSDKVVASAKTVYDLLAAVNSAADTLKGRVDGHDTKLEEYGEDISGLETLTGTQGEAITGLQTLTGTQGEAIDALETLTGTQGEAITGLQTLTGTQGEAIAALQGSSGTQGEKLTELEGELDDLSAVVNALTHLTIETVEGDITVQVTEPKTDVLYMQRDNSEDKTWMLYVYQNGSWINVGDTEVDLSNYWTMDEAHKEPMREFLSIHDAEAIPTANITSAVEAAFTGSAVSLA